MCLRVFKPSIPVARDLISHGGSPAEMKEREGERDRKKEGVSEKKGGAQERKRVE